MVYQEKNARTGVRQFCFDVVFSLYPPVLPGLGVQVAELEDARQHARQPRLSDHGDTRRPRRICGARQGKVNIWADDDEYIGYTAISNKNKNLRRIGKYMKGGRGFRYG